jgi:6-phosphogluconolactonase (cycloisomerase 2 family)
MAFGVLLAVPFTLARAADPVPLRVVSDPSPNFHGIAVDTVNNEIIVTDDNGHQILVYSRTASGPALPLRSIQGTSTDLDFPSSVAIEVNAPLVCPSGTCYWINMNDTSDRSAAHDRLATGNHLWDQEIDYKSLVPNEKRGYGLSVDSVNREVVVSFQRNATGGSVVVFDDQGVAALRTIAGNLTTLADPHGVFDDNVNNEIVVANEGHVYGVTPADPSIAVFSRTATGNVAPLRTIRGALTGLNQPKNLQVDTTNNEIYVANSGGNSITVYSRTAVGNVAPLRTLTGPLTGLSSPSGLFVDTVNNELLVANWGNHSLTVYSRTASGNVAPLRTLNNAPAGQAQVGIGNPGAMALDTVNNEYYVTNCVSHPRIAVFPRTANGTVAPTRVIEGLATRLSRSMHGVAVDSVNNEVLAPSTMEDAVVVFPRTASGNAAPLRVIQGSLTLINKAQGIAVDTVNNEIAVANEAAVPPSITIYSRTATGNVAPLRVITSSVAITKPVGVFIDAVNNEILVDDGTTGSESILVFPRLANGLTAPLRQIVGASTGLFKVRQLVVDNTNNEILIASQGDRAIDPPQFGNLAVFSRTATGNVAPLRFIQQVINSGVQHPRSVWVDPGNNEIGVGDSKGNNIRVFPRLF